MPKNLIFIIVYIYSVYVCVCLIFNPQMSKLPCNIAQEHILSEMWYVL